MKKKILGLVTLLIIMVMFVMQTSVFAKSFPDVPITHLNYDAIMRLTKMGVVAGYDDGTFDPQREITRTEFCALMARTLGYNKDTYRVKDVPFTDVPDYYWGRAYISFCYEKGLINGIGGGKFAPADKVTVAQVVKIVVCAADLEDEVRGGDTWYSGYMKVAKAYGLLAENNQDATDNAFRGNAAQLVYNLLESQLIPEEEMSQEQPSEDEDAPETNKTESNNNREENESKDEGSKESSKDDSKNQADKDREDSEEDEEEVEEEVIDPKLAALRAEYAKKDFSDVKVIVVDAGHNYSGKDIGAQNEELDLKEEIITWEIADRVRRKLEKMGYTVIMTREDVTDNIVPSSQRESLQARVDLAHDNLADLFISIHCNMGGGTGTETYCYTMGGYSARLAKIVQSNIVEKTGLRDRGVKNASFYVIRHTIMPAILVETAFMDNVDDVEVITSASGQDKIAQAIANAVKEYDSMGPLKTEKASADEEE